MEVMKSKQKKQNLLNRSTNMANFTLDAVIRLQRRNFSAFNLAVRFGLNSIITVLLLQPTDARKCNLQLFSSFFSFN
uniref:Transmembrane protein n=1 Tax=Lotus japonicus TaxID=34305 RepID=I3T8X1_LOTJA|nr:unknown [Lotus japonicus]